ncbi:hypothetical protein ACFFKU_07490 [Kineococcus gynurae]|uniref:Uncharacterized protein n=1 Tax=Kineococcus gynurae TaxID=452979 RepID=A0ABV5LWV1_9ACTN
MNTTAPQAVWVTVTDTQGQRHLEMRWITPLQESTPLAAAA